MRFLAIDYGSRKVGLATADSELKIAVPRPAFYYNQREELLAHIKKFVSEEEIDQIVIGLPLSLSFQETQISRETREFAEQLKGEFSVAIVFENEVMSTKEAEAQKSVIFRKIKTRSPKKQIDLDSQAAAIILDSYLQRTKQEID